MPHRKLLLPLRLEHLRSGQPAPTPAFTAAVAHKLIRRNDDATGAIVIPNARSVLGSKRRVFAFQRALMADLLRHFRKHQPSALRTAGMHLFDARPMCKRIRRKRLHADNAARFPYGGLVTYKKPHMDIDSQLFVSLCYYDVHDIAGGSPRLLDMHRLTPSVRRRRALRDWLDVVQDVIIFVPNEVATRLKHGKRREAQRATIIVRDLDFDQMPILVLSNRIEDGILHGATPTRTTGPRPRRSLNYVSIGHR